MSRIMSLILKYEIAEQRSEDVLHKPNPSGIFVVLYRISITTVLKTIV